MNIRENAIVPDKYRSKMPFLMFKRVDLRNGVSSLPVPFKTDFGGDFLLKRTIFRFSGKCRMDPDPDPSFLPAPVVEPLQPVELDYTPLGTVRYLDLSLTTDSHLGSDVDPFSVNDWQDYLIANTLDTTFYVKGTYSTAADLNVNSTGERCDYIAWNPAVNGPPRLTCRSPVAVSMSVVFNGFMLNFTLVPCILAYPVVFESCYVESTVIMLKPGRVENHSNSGSTFKASGMILLQPDVPANYPNYSLLTNNTHAYSEEFWADANRTVQYDMAFSSGTRFNFLASGYLYHEVAAWNDMDLVNDYLLSMKFRVHSSNESLTENRFCFGLRNGPDLAYGIDVKTIKTDSKVIITIFIDGVQHEIYNEINSFEMDMTVDFRKVGASVLTYINDVYFSTIAYDDAGHAGLSSLKPNLFIIGSSDVDGATEFTIKRLKNDSTSTFCANLFDCIITTPELTTSGGFYYNCYINCPLVHDTASIFIHTVTGTLINALPLFSGTQADFTDIQQFIDLQPSPITPNYGLILNYPGYNTGLWGYQRRMIGAFDFSFPNVRYVNLDLAGAFGGIGTPTDPFSFFDLHIYTGTAVVNTLFLVRGSYYNDAVYDFFWSKTGLVHTYRAWNFELYGPWRLRTIYGLDMDSALTYVHDAIIFGRDAAGARIDITEEDIQPQFINCHLFGLSFNTWNLYPYAGIGCLVDFTNVDQGGIGFIDSLIKTDNLTGGGTPDSWVNCGIYAGVNSIPLNHFLNCFLTWTPPLTFPDWNNPDPMAWYYLLFQTDIPDAVFIGAGTPAYTGYESGIFGVARLAIGALYFPPLVEVCPADILVSLRKMTSAHKIYTAIPPHLFSSPVDKVDSVPVAAPLPVDDYLFNTLFKGSVRLSEKTYNWIVEDNATIVIDIDKRPAEETEPEFIDIIVEGYFLKQE
jgi:hypothetical protein